jgi:hypothetical protein
MRWSLAIQEYEVSFRHLREALMVVPDCLSRNVHSADDGD